jgi:hypothetical protein
MGFSFTGRQAGEAVTDIVADGTDSVRHGTAKAGA